MDCSQGRSRTRSGRRGTPGESRNPWKASRNPWNPCPCACPCPCPIFCLSRLPVFFLPVFVSAPQRHLRRVSASVTPSWAQAFRNGGILSYGTAAWNTYASIHNTYSAWRNLGGAFASLGDFFGGRKSERDRNDNGGIVVVILLVLFALLAGVLTTTVIIRRVAASDPLPPYPSREPERTA